MARKLEFDKGEALHKAMRLFWEKGYEASSMEDLVQAMEINRFSIYNSFGDKKALLILALEHYRCSVLHSLIAPLKSSHSGIECLTHYFDHMNQQLSSNAGRLGCFVQKTGQSHIAIDPEVSRVLSAMLHDLHEALLDAVDRAMLKGELKGCFSSKHIVLFILSQMQGLILLRHSGKDLPAIKAQIEMLKQTVLAW